MNIKRPVFSTPLLLMRGFFKSNLDSFVGGLILGAVFSLMVNIVTVQIQDVVTRQRVLEAVEYEIFNNTSQAETTVREVSQNLNKTEVVDFYHNFLKYSDKIYNSGEFLKYGLSLDPETQTSMHIYYEVTVKFNNEILSKNDVLTQNQLGKCFLDNGVLRNKSDDDCIHAFNYLLLLETQSAGRVFNQGIEILKKFHPTKDRLSSPLLRLFIGDQTIGALRNGGAR